MDSKRLLIEYKPLTYDKTLIKEQVESGAPITLSGVFQESGTLNQNGRVYPHEILAREIEKFGEMMRENRAYGALDHPESSIIELSNAAVLIKELGWDGNKLMGKLQVLNTQKGKDLQAILEAGGAVGVSSRAFGSTHRNNEGHEIVNDDLALITFDTVANPSVTKAILNESYDRSKTFFFNPTIDRKIAIDRILEEILRF